MVTTSCHFASLKVVSFSTLFLSFWYWRAGAVLTSVGFFIAVDGVRQQQGAVRPLQKLLPVSHVESFICILLNSIRYCRATSGFKATAKTVVFHKCYFSRQWIIRLWMIIILVSLSK